MIAYDRLILDANVDLYISFDNEKVGTLMGELLREALEDEGTIICINGSPTDNNVKLVFGGFKKALQGSDILIDETGYADHWRRSASILSAIIWQKAMCRMPLCAAMTISRRRW